MDTNQEGRIMNEQLPPRGPDKTVGRIIQLEHSKAVEPGPGGAFPNVSDEPVKLFPDPPEISYSMDAPLARAIGFAWDTGNERLRQILVGHWPRRLIDIIRETGAEYWHHVGTPGDLIKYATNIWVNDVLEVASSTELWKVVRHEVKARTLAAKGDSVVEYRVETCGWWPEGIRIGAILEELHRRDENGEDAFDHAGVSLEAYWEPGK